MKRLAALLALSLLCPTPSWAQYGGGGEAPPAPPAPDMTKIRELRLQFAREPTVIEVQHAALRFFQVHPDKVNGYLSGARSKALVPDLELSWSYDHEDTDSKLRDQLYVSNPLFQDFKERNFGNRVNQQFGVRAHWSLDRLVFNAEILDVTSLVGVQEGLIREITSLYYTRRRLLTILALSPPQDPGEKITEQIRLDEITANLDALTGGWLSEELKKRSGQGPADEG